MHLTCVSFMAFLQMKWWEHKSLCFYKTKEKINNVIYKECKCTSIENGRMTVKCFLSTYELEYNILQLQLVSSDLLELKPTNKTT